MIGVGDAVVMMFDDVDGRKKRKKEKSFRAFLYAAKKPIRNPNAVFFRRFETRRHFWSFFKKNTMTVTQCPDLEDYCENADRASEICENHAVHAADVVVDSWGETHADWADTVDRHGLESVMVVSGQTSDACSWIGCCSLRFKSLNADSITGTDATGAEFTIPFNAIVAYN